MVEWLKQHQLPCFYNSIFGIECPSCGFQRALILLLEGRLKESLVMYPALLPTVLVFLLVITWLIVKIPTRRTLTRLLIADLGIILVSYFYKMFSSI